MDWLSVTHELNPMENNCSFLVLAVTSMKTSTRVSKLWASIICEEENTNQTLKKSNLIFFLIVFLLYSKLYSIHKTLRQVVVSFSDNAACIRSTNESHIVF